MTPTGHQALSPNDDELPRVDYDLIKWHGFAALITLFISAIFGTLVAIKFTYPEFLGSTPWLTWGRLRYDHTQGILFGWLGNAFLAFLYHAVPRLCDRPVLSRGLGGGLFLVWNFVVLLPGWALVLAAPSHWLFASQPLEWAEFPISVDVFATVGLLLIVLQFVVPIVRSRVPGGLYVSGWYIIGGAVFTLFAYPVGNLVPEFLPGAEGAAFSGLWIHDAVGLYITPFAVAIAYYVIPAVTGRPIYSHFLSMIGFWLLFFVYPLNGTHHYVYSALPMDAQKAAIVASAYLGMDVILVVFNQLMSLRGQGGKVGGDLPLRFVFTGTVFYLIVSLQGSLQASMPVNRLTHFSDWVIGHSHLAMLGFATFTAAGGIMHIWRSLPATRYNPAAVTAAYWLLLTGLLLMVVDLTAAGLVQGELWGTSAPWIESVRASSGYWIVRTLSAVPLLAGFIALLVAISTGPRSMAAGHISPIARDPSPGSVPVPAE